MAGSQGSQVGSAHISIFPTMAGFRSAVDKEVRASGSSASSSFSKAFKGAGRKSGAQLGRELKAAFKSSSSSMADQVLSPFRKDVAKATADLSKARSKLADDAGRVRVAEARLSETIAKSGEGSASAVAASERLRSARSRLAASTSSYKGALDRLKSAEAGLARAQAEVDKAAARSGSVFARAARSMSSAARSVSTSVSGALSGAFSRLPSSIQAPLSAASSRFRSAVSSIQSAASSGASAVKGAFSKIPASIKGAFSKLPSFIRGPLSSAAGAVKGAVSSISGAMPKLASAVRSGASQALSGIRSFGSGVAGALSSAVPVIATGAAAIAAALAMAGSAALGSYAQYEQLVGGVDTLFKDASAQVQAYAERAYQTAGLSANAYMETVTGFSASLLQGLGGDTARAAEIADLAVTDMADNANKMGTSMELIQNAYQGFAKDNYTMLDNLKLGYGGTQAEMARLINDTGVLGDSMKVTAETVKDVPFDKMIEAIHRVQTEMGITGTTALEASTTIEGSVNSAKAAWSNWLTELGKDDADMATLTDQLVTSVATAARNIVPRLGTIFSSLGTTLATGIDAFIHEDLPGALTDFQTWVSESLPAIMEAGGTMLGGIVQGAIDNLPQITEAGLQLVSTLASSVGSALPALVPMAGQAVVNFAQGLVVSLPQLIQSGLSMVTGLSQGIAVALPQLAAQAPQLIGSLVSAIVSNLPLILEAGVQILTNLAVGFANSIPARLGQIPGMVSQIKDAFLSVDWGSVGINIITGIGAGIAQAAGTLVDAAVSAASSAIDTVKGWLGIESPSKRARDEIGRYIPAGIAVGIERGTGGLLSSARAMSDDLMGSIRRDAGALTLAIEGPSSGSGRHGAPRGREVSQTFIFNQPVQTPDELARAMRLRERYGLAAVQ